MPQDARNKLRQMGGIISSYPELIQAAQGPTAGGGVAAVERGAPAEGWNQFDPRYMGVPPAPAPDSGPGTGFRDWVQGVGRAVRGSGKEMFLDPLDTILGYGVGAANMPVAGAAAATGVIGDFLGAEGFADLMYDQASNTYGGGLALIDQGYFGAQDVRPSDVRSTPGKTREAAEERARQEAMDKTLELYGPGSEGGPTRPPPQKRPRARPTRPDDAELAQSMADRAIQLMQPPPDDDEKTLRERYDEQMALINEVFGEEKADNRAMDLAMIGLSILAAEGPNAINNIARGALSGLQSIGARRDAERERETALRSMALQGAIDQQAAAAQADADAAMAQFDRETDLLVQQLRNQGGGQSANSRDELYRSLLEKIADDPGTYGALTEDNEVDPERIKAIARQLANEYNTAVAQQVASDLEANVPPDQIRQELLGAGHNPELYGL